MYGSLPIDAALQSAAEEPALSLGPAVGTGVSSWRGISESSCLYLL